MGTHKEQEPAKPKSWTVMLYMAASKDEQTERAAILDLTELEKVGTDDSKLNVLVQIDRKWPGYAERYCVRKGYSEICDALEGQKNIDSGKPKDINSGKPNVLREFVKWGRSTFPAEHYLLVLWGHSYGLGFGRDHGDALTLRELATALDRDALELPIARDRKAVDILGANACALSYAEAAYELQDAADFLVAPEITMPFAGWPYQIILNEIIKNPAIEPKEFGEKIIDRFAESFEEAVEPQSVALTLLDLGKAGEIEPPLTKLTSALHNAIRRSEARDLIRDAFLETAHGDVRPLIDLVDLCEKLVGLDDTVAKKVIEAAEDLSAFLQPAQGFVLKHRAGRELEGLHGVGIFAPSVTGTADLMRLDLSEKEYKELKLAKKTKWTQFAYTDLKDLLDPMNKAVAEFVNGTGATGREERAGVAQLLVGIHQSFLKLERTVAETQANAMNVLNGNGGGSGPASRSLEHTTVVGRFGPPFLRLAPNLPPPQYPNGSAASEMSLQTNLPAGNGDEKEADSGTVKSLAESLAKLEDALANVERTAKRVMTHSSLGLGADPPVKTGLGADPPVKTGLGADPPVKTGLGADPPVKTGLGIFPTGGSGYFSSPSNANNVAELYGQVAWSLQLIEQAVAGLESVVQTEVSGRANGFRDGVDYRQRVTDQVNGSFRELASVTANARQIAVQVLSHPAYGLGPSPQSGLGVANRQQLAIAGGLSPRVLRLLL